MALKFMPGKQPAAGLRPGNTHISQRPQGVVICGEKTTADVFYECVTRLSLTRELRANTIYRAQI
jgi:hypothetical protein